jgi:hypothetical protein
MTGSAAEIAKRFRHELTQLEFRLPNCEVLSRIFKVNLSLIPTQFFDIFNGVTQ